MDDLVRTLSQGDHPIVVSRARTANELQESIERGYVLVEFTDTRGGTELGVELDHDASDIASADYERSTGIVVLVGGLTLNEVPVRCTAEIDLATLSGTGMLEVVP